MRPYPVVQKTVKWLRLRSSPLIIIIVENKGNSGNAEVPLEIKTLEELDFSVRNNSCPIFF